MKATTPHSSVQAMVPLIWTSRSRLKTVPSWCSVRHHVTEKWTIGMSTAATSAATAERLARTFGSSGTRRSAR